MDKKNIILIVDDNIENINVLSEILETNGYEVLIATSGQDAIKTLSITEPSLILLDINMPVMSGYEVCSKLKDNKQTGDIPVIFLSALSEVMDMVKAFEVGGLDYITKPYIPEIVLARVKTHIELYRIKLNLEKIVADRTAELRNVNEELLITTDSLKENYIQLEEAKEKSEESDRLKTAFLQNLSHEIRTPLNAIVGFSGLINTPEISEEKRKNFSSIIQNSSHQLLTIVNDILTISSLETNQEKTKKDSICINNLLLNLHTIFKPQAHNRKISIYLKQDLGDKESEIYTDSLKLNQIITNLLTNAMKFTYEGFIEFGYRFLTKTADNQCFLQFYVKDTGIGIPYEQQDKIFERFRQADLSINKKYGGTGLGLSISKGFVELLGGKIWVESEPDKGSVFYFTIPYTPVQENNQIVVTEKAHKDDYCILIAEDEEYNYIYLEELLKERNTKFIHAKNGKEAIELCKENPKIDLVLMDIKMPVMDGHTAAIQIKTFRPELPIIAQSAYALLHEIEKYRGIFDDYITKPINESELKQKLSKYIPTS